MHQIPYSISRMLCHILIGFVGGTIFINSGKLPAMYSFQDVADGIGSECKSLDSALRRCDEKATPP